MKTIRFCIENPLFGDERKDVPVNEAPLELKKSLDLGMFAVAKNDDGSTEVLTKKMSEEEITEKIKDADEVSVHKKDKGG